MFGATTIVGFANADADTRNIAPITATSTTARTIGTLLGGLLRRI